jgi:hypothetical protein
MQNKLTPEATRLNTLRGSSGNSTFTKAKPIAMGVNTPQRVGTALDFDQTEASSDPPIVEAIHAMKTKWLQSSQLLANAKVNKMKKEGDSTSKCGFCTLLLLDSSSSAIS